VPARRGFLGCAAVINGRRLAILLVAGCVGASPCLTAQEPQETKPGVVQTRKYDFKDAGKEMEYALFVPKNYDKTRKTPLMVALHGLGSTPQIIMRYPKLTAEAEKRGYIVVAPMGYNAQGWYGQRAPGKKKVEPENLSELSEKDVMNVLAIVRKDFNIDDDRIYLMGHSMGGGGTFHLALKHPDIWAALAPIAPAIFRKATDVEKIKHIPVILIQGDMDKLVTVERVRPWADEMKKLGMSYEYIEVAGGGHVDVAFQNIPKIFDFFDKHRRNGKEKAPAKADQALHRPITLPAGSRTVATRTSPSAYGVLTTSPPCRAARATASLTPST
jgi:poly(3-hydroxybutyrate) depolymerase